MHVMDEASGLQIINDVRRGALAQQRSLAIARHRAQHLQGYLTGRGSIDAGRDVLRHGSVLQQAAFAHVATNTIHHFWPAAHPARVAAGAPAERLQSLRCAPCDQPLTLSHLASCDAAIASRHRQRQRSDILQLASADPASRAWSERMRGSSLRELLLNLFPSPQSASADEQHRHLTAVMCGLFTAVEGKAAARALGFEPLAHAELARTTITRFRLLCLDSISRLYAELKAAAP